MRIMDIYKNEVIHLYRPLRCDSCCFPCCLQSIEVSAPPGNVIGTIQQEWSLCYPTYAIKNAAGDTVLRIEGPCCTCRMCCDVKFRVSCFKIFLRIIVMFLNFHSLGFLSKITSLNGEQVGKISKQWSGLMREMFTDADYFGITFPMDLDVKMKAVMLGACFLIVSTYTLLLFCQFLLFNSLINV